MRSVLPSCMSLHREKQIINILAAIALGGITSVDLVLLAKILCV